MAKNTGKRKRDPVKWVRDRAKSAYEKKPECAICGTTEDLELHHFHSLTLLFEKWAKANNLPIDTDDEVIAVRDDFIQQHHKHLYLDVVTLCNAHHVKLHIIYGPSPAPTTASKQPRWVAKQAIKYGRIYTPAEELSSGEA